MLARMLALCALFAAALPLSAQSPKPATAPAKLKIYSPLHFHEKLQMPGLDASTNSRTVNRYGFQEAEDKIEGTSSRTLRIYSRNDVYVVGSDVVTEAVSWRFVAEKDTKGKLSSYLVFGALTPKNELGLTATRSASDFSLVYRPGEEPVNVSAKSFADTTSALAKHNVRVTFEVSPKEMLDIADAGALRLKYQEGRRDFELTEEDRECIRWFVASKTPNGAALLNERYEVLQRPEGQASGK